MIIFYCAKAFFSKLIKQKNRTKIDVKDFRHYCLIVHITMRPKLLNQQIYDKIDQTLDVKVTQINFLLDDISWTVTLSTNQETKK